MDLFEKKIKEWYGEKRKLDEKSIPEFNAFVSEPEIKMPVRRLHTFYLTAASIAVIVISAAVFFYYYYKPNKEEGHPGQMLSINMNQLLPTQSLLNPGNSTAFIWQWKSPTDHLLKDAEKTMHLKK